MGRTKAVSGHGTRGGVRVSLSGMSLGDLYKQADATRREIEGYKLLNKHVDCKSGYWVLVRRQVCSAAEF